MGSQPDEDFLGAPSRVFGLSEPLEQEQERKTEKANITNALPIVKDILKRLDERIEFYASVDSIPNEIVGNPEEFMHTVHANKIVKANLESEKNYLESLLEDL